MITDPWETSGRTDRRLAAEFGVTCQTVAQTRRRLESRGLIPHRDIRVAADGRVIDTLRMRGRKKGEIEPPQPKTPTLVGDGMAKRRALEESLIARPERAEQTNKSLAAEFRISLPTVARARRSLEQSGAIPRLDRRIAANGKPRRVRRSRR